MNKFTASEAAIFAAEESLFLTGARSSAAPRRTKRLRMIAIDVFDSYRCLYDVAYASSRKAYQIPDLMIEAKRYLTSVPETDLTTDILLSLDAIGRPALDGSDVVFTGSLARKRPLPGLLYFDQDGPGGEMHFRLRFYGGEVLRLLASRTPRAFLGEGPMLEWHPTLGRQPVRLDDRPEGWQAIAGGRAFFRAEAGSIGPQFSRDGKALLEFQAAPSSSPTCGTLCPS